MPGSRNACPGIEMPWSGGGGDLLGDGRLAVGRLVLVNNALARGLVQLASGVALKRGSQLNVASRESLVELADGGLQRRLDRLVAQPGLFVLPVALDLGLDVRHATASSCSFRVIARNGPAFDHQP